MNAPVHLTVTADNKSYIIPVRREMSFLLTPEVLSAFKWRDDDEDTSDQYKEIEDC